MNVVDVMQDLHDKDLPLFGEIGWLVIGVIIGHLLTWSVSASKHADGSVIKSPTQTFADLQAALRRAD